MNIMLNKKQRTLIALKENFQISCSFEDPFHFAKYKIEAIAEEKIYEFPILSVENWYSYLIHFCLLSVAFDKIIVQI